MTQYTFRYAQTGGHIITVRAKDFEQAKIYAEPYLDAAWSCTES